MTLTRQLPSLTGAAPMTRCLAGAATVLFFLVVAGNVSAYTFEYCKGYADKVVQESTTAALSNAMRGTTSDPGLSGLTGSGSHNDPNSLSGVLGGLAESQDQQSLWQRTFNHCMGVSR